MNARLDLRLDATDAFGAELMLDAKATGKRSGTTLKMDPTRSKVAGNVLGDLDATLNNSDLHHADLTLSSVVEGATWSRRVVLELGRKVTLKLPDFLGDTNAAPVIEAINNVALDGTETATVNLVASDPNETDTLSFSTTNLPSWATLTDNGDGTGSIFFDPPAGSAGEYVVTVSVSDSMVTTSTDFTVTVGAGVASLEGTEFTGAETAKEDFSESAVTKESGGGVEASTEGFNLDVSEEQKPDFESLTVKRLDDLLNRYEQSSEGIKADKIKRLTDYYDQASEQTKRNLRNDVEEL